MSLSLSVVIPTLNDHTLVAALEALQCQADPPDEVIVVGRYDVQLTRAFPSFRFIDTQEPRCAAASRNIGIGAAGGAIVAFTDSDCLPSADWVAKHREAHGAGALVVGGGVLLAGDNYWAQADNVSMFHEFLALHPPSERHVLPTLNLSVRRSVIDAVGLLDESFPGAAGEDTDWCHRMRLAGYTLQFDPRATVRHAPARTTWPDIVRHWRNAGNAGVRVRLRYRKYYGTPRFVQSALLLRLLSPLIAAWVTMRIYANPLLWPQWRYLPVVYVTKIIYCLGAARSVSSGFALAAAPEAG